MRLIGKTWLGNSEKTTSSMLWASLKVRECCNKVEAEDAGRLSFAEDILRTSTDFQRRIIEQEESVTLSYVCPHCQCFSLENYICWVSSGHEKKQCHWWCAACGQYDWRAPNRVVARQDSTDREATVFRAHAAPCDTLINAENWQKGERPVGELVPGLLERGRSRIMDGLRNVIAVDSHEAVTVCTEKRGARRWQRPSSRQTSRELLSGTAWRSSPCEHMKKVCCAPSSTPRMWEAKDGGLSSRRVLAPRLPDHFSWSRRTRLGSHVLPLQGPTPSGEKQDIWRKHRDRL